MHVHDTSLAIVIIYKFIEYVFIPACISLASQTLHPSFWVWVHETIGMYINVKSCVRNVSFAVILQLTLLGRETINDCDTRYNKL